MSRIPHRESETWVTRREFGRSLLTVLPSVWLVRLCWDSDALAEPAHSHLETWVLHLHRTCRDLETQALTPTQWQTEIEALFSDIDRNEFLDFIDFDRLIEGIRYPEDRAATRRYKFPDIDGVDGSVRWGPKIFALQKGTAIVPHAHNHMVSSHFVLKGEFHVRTYDRLADEDGHLILAPSIDRTVRRGEIVTMSDDRDNVHWFVAKSDHAFTFDLPVVDLFPLKVYPTPAQYMSMIFVDPLGPKNRQGHIEAPVLEPEECIRKFGRT